MFWITRTAFLIGIIVITCSGVSAQQDSVSKPFADIPKLAQRIMKKWHIPGVAIGVVQDGQIVYMQGFGYRDVEQKLPVDEKTLFNICSLSKAFTSLSVAMLVDQGKLDWDTPVIRYLPDFWLHDEYATEHTTLRDILCHRTGVGRHDDIWKKTDYDRGEIIERLSELEPIGSFRNGYAYSNVMYTVAGYVVGKVSGGTWEQFVSTSILDPLGMERTNFSIDDSRLDSNFAYPYGYNKKNDEYWIPESHDYVPIAPAGGIFSCLEEMCEWLNLHVNLGRVGNTVLIAEEQISITHTPQIITGASSTSVSAYCMGWSFGERRGVKQLAHDGGTRGYQAVIKIMPEQKIGLVALSNMYGHYLDYLIVNSIADRLLSLEEVDYYAQYKPLVSPDLIVEE